MVKSTLPLTVLSFIVLVLVSCTISPPQPGNPHQILFDNVAAWLNANASTTESIAVPRGSSTNFGDRHIVTVPNQTGTFDTLGIINMEKPDYVLAVNSITWDGVIHQPWFQQRYKALHTIYDNYDMITPAVIFGYRPSPFDIGETTKVTQKFTDGAPIISSYRINTMRLFPERMLYLSITWLIASADYADKVYLTLQLYSDKEQKPVYTVMEAFNPAYETFFDKTYITTYHIVVLPSTLAVGPYSLRIFLNQENGAPFSVKTLTGEEQGYVNLTALEHPPLVSTAELIPSYSTTYHFLESNQPIITLSGYDMLTQTLTGARLRVGLVWRTIQTPSGDYTVFVHIRDAANNVVAQVDNKPINWTYPTLKWQTGQYIYDEHIVDLDENLPRGIYRLYVGLYDAQTTRRLPVLNSSGERLVDDEIPLSDLKIR